MVHLSVQPDPASQGTPFSQPQIQPQVMGQFSGQGAGNPYPQNMGTISGTASFVPQSNVMPYTQTSATPAMILAIIGLVVNFIFPVGWILSIISVVMCSKNGQIVKTQTGHPDKSMHTVAVVLNWITLVLTAIGVIFAAVLIAAFSSGW